MSSLSHTYNTSAANDERNYRKQVDRVNYSRLDDAWRRRVFNYVTRLVKFRTNSNTLAKNDTNFLYVDFHEGKRVLVWQRGTGDDIVIAIANFSDWGTTNPGNPPIPLKTRSPHQMGGSYPSNIGSQFR